MNPPPDAISPRFPAQLLSMQANALSFRVSSLCQCNSHLSGGLKPQQQGWLSSCSLVRPVGCNGVIKRWAVWACAASAGHLCLLAGLRGCNGAVYRCWAAGTRATSAGHHTLAASMLHVQLPELQCRPAGRPQASNLRSHERLRVRKAYKEGVKDWAPEHASHGLTAHCTCLVTAAAWPPSP